MALAGTGLHLPSWVTLAVSVNLARRKAGEPAGRCLPDVVVGLSFSDHSQLFIWGIMVGLMLIVGDNPLDGANSVIIMTLIVIMMIIIILILKVVG